MGQLDGKISVITGGVESTTFTVRVNCTAALPEESVTL